MTAAAAQILPPPPVEPSLEDFQDRAKVLALVESRLEPSMIDQLLTLGFDRAEVHSIVLPARTLQHRRSRKERLTLEESDRVIRLLRVLRNVEDVYGSRERALAWLRRPNPRLDPALRNVLFAKGGRVPLTMLNTEAGARAIEELLMQINDGMYI